MDWFSRLTGFAERNHADVHRLISISGSTLTSTRCNGSYQCGRLELASLGTLRERNAGLPSSGNLRVAELVGDAKTLHAVAANAGAVFQVASQFNLLEMVSPNVTPEHGVTIYENDPTQGPACAIACGAGTIYRNYFVELDGQVGQTAGQQVDCLADIGAALGNTSPHPQPLSFQEPAAQEGRGERKGRLWVMRNGYALPSKHGLAEIDERLKAMSDSELDELRAKLKIGVQWDTQVTFSNREDEGCSHLVTQAYCSALPVAYSGLTSAQWERFARLILEAAYESTLAVAALNAANTGNRTVFLTLLGGGAFGNDQRWILDAIHRACILFAASDLDVKIVSYRSSNPAVKQLVASIQRKSGDLQR